MVVTEEFSLYKKPSFYKPIERMMIPQDTLFAGCEEGQGIAID
jgi:hypothetical protein